MRPVGLDQRELQGGSMVVEGTLTHPCPGFAVGKLAMVVVRVQGAPDADTRPQFKHCHSVARMSFAVCVVQSIGSCRTG
jgi:hypothetical protein